MSTATIARASDRDSIGQLLVVSFQRVSDKVVRIVARQSFCLLGFFLSSSSFVAATAETCVRARSKAGLGVDARLRRHVAQRCVKEAMLKVALLSSYRSREVETSSVPTYEKGHSVVSLLSKCWLR